MDIEEFKGRKPIRRSGLEINVRAEDFDNPLLERHFHASSGDTRSHGKRLILDFDQLTTDTACHALFLEAHRVSDRPLVLWYAAPPGAAGFRRCLIHAKTGRGVAHWFAQSGVSWTPSRFREAGLTSFTFGASRTFGHRFPYPDHTPLEQAEKVARWIAAQKRDGVGIHPLFHDRGGTTRVRMRQSKGS